VENSVPDGVLLPAQAVPFAAPAAESVRRVPRRRRPGSRGRMSSPRPESQPAQQQTPPGTLGEMTPKPDHGEESYRGSGKLTGKAAVITGADSGIGRAVAIAFAREGADVLISYLSEHDDAKETARYVEEAGRKCVLVAGDLSDRAHAKTIIPKAVEAFGKVDVLVNNAAFQMTHESLDEISDDEWDHTVATNLTAMFILCKDALPHMPAGGSIINSSSVNSDMPSPQLAPYAMTKAGIANFTASLAQMYGEKGIRANSVAPGPIWTPLIPSTMPEEKVESFGGDTPLGRAGQPAELAPVYVLLASDEGSYISGARIAVTGGRPIL
jgi:NAD(P)-dependent dehydrogenase (short-subunit alcohol dehydrogenase family)